MKKKQQSLSVATNQSLEIIDNLYQKVSSHIENARQHIQRSVDGEMVKTYWLTGREIVE